MTPSPSDPDLWGPDVDIDPRDIEDEPEPDVDDPRKPIESDQCVDCGATLDPDDYNDLLCWNCERLHDATRGDLEEGETVDG